MIKEQENEVIEKDYFKDLQEIKEIITGIQNEKDIIDNTIIMTYYEIGTIINKRKAWGSKYIKNLANNLKEHDGYSYDNLILMARFAKEFKNKNIYFKLLLTK